MRLSCVNLSSFQNTNRPGRRGGEYKEERWDVSRVSVTNMRLYISVGEGGHHPAQILTGERLPRDVLGIVSFRAQRQA